MKGAANLRLLLFFVVEEEEEEGGGPLKCCLAIRLTLRPELGQGDRLEWLLVPPCCIRIA